MLDVRNGGGGLVDRLHLALDRLHPTNHILQLTGGSLEILIEVLEPGGRVAVGSQSVVVLRAHPGDVLGQLAELSTERIGIGPERRKGTLKTEEGFHLLPKEE